MACAGCARRREKLKVAAQKTKNWATQYVVFDKDRVQPRKTGPK